MQLASSLRRFSGESNSATRPASSTRILSQTSRTATASQPWLMTPALQDVPVSIRCAIMILLSMVSSSSCPPQWPAYKVHPAKAFLMVAESRDSQEAASVRDRWTCLEPSARSQGPQMMWLRRKPESCSFAGGPAPARGADVGLPRSCQPSRGPTYQDLRPVIKLVSLPRSSDRKSVV